MRKFIYISGLAALLTGLVACTDRDKDTVLADQAQTEVTFSYAAVKTAGGMTPCVLVFRRHAAGFLYEQTIADGWTASGENKFTRPVPLAVGEYKFLFAAGYGTHTHLSPQPVAGATDFDDVSFRNTFSGDNVFSADELFMQFPLAEAGNVYEISGPANISCTLRRVASQVFLHLKRGYRDNGTFIPDPYTDGSDNIVRHIQRIDFTLDGVAKGISPAGSQGEGNTSDSLSLAGITPDQDGFATLPGPFFIPVDGQPLKEATFTFHLQPGSSLTELTKTVDLGNLTVLPDQKLEITLWFNSFDSPIDIRADVTTAFLEQEGDQGGWY